MKLLILIDQIHQSGGLERTLAHKVQYWQESRPDIDMLIVTNEGGNLKPYYNYGDARRIDLDINYCRESSLFGKNNLRKAFHHFKALRKLLKSERPDIVLLCGFGFDFYFLPLVKGGAKTIKENHSSRVKLAEASLITKIKNKIRRLVESYYNVMVFLSDEESKAVGLRNSIVLPNCLYPMTQQLLIERENLVIAAGRITPIKGFDRLIEIWGGLGEKKPDWKLEIYGDGELAYLTFLQELISEKGLNDQIKITPAIVDIEKRMLTASIFAMTSRTECFPMVILEAMQLGVPIIAYDCPTGPRNILCDEHTGLLIADGDSHLYKEKLLSLINSPSLRDDLASNAKEAVKAYEVKNVMGQWERLLDSLLES